MRAEHTMRHQRGLITRSDASASGLTEAQIAHRLRTGEWEAVARGVYRHAAAPHSWHQSIQAAVLATGGVASFGTALSLFGIEHGASRAVHVTVDRSARHRRMPGVTVHRSTQWDGRQEVVRQGIACTGIERTLLDVAHGSTVDLLERAAEEAVRRRLTSFERIARYLVMHGGRGRAGSATMRTLLLQRDPDAVLPLSDFSRAVFQMIAAAELPLPVLEHRIRDRRGRFVMQVDIAWPDRRCAVELDGLAWHFGRSDVERDRRKRARARAEGWRVLEVLWSMYEHERTELVALLTDFLATSTPRP